LPEVAGINLPENLTTEVNRETTTPVMLINFCEPVSQSH
jgi:hypothetical protein